MSPDPAATDEKLIAVARHIAKTLGHTDTMADDIIDVFSNFDRRLSRENLFSSSDGEFSGSLRSRISSFLALEQPIWSSSSTAADFLSCVDQLLSVDSKDSDDLLQQCVPRLEYEFKTILEYYPLDPVHSSPFDDEDCEEDELEEEDESEIPVANPVKNYDIIIDAIPPGAIADLNEIAKRIVGCGFSREIAIVYSLSRSDFLDESLSRLGLKPRSTEEIGSTPWNVLEDEIHRWNKGVTLAIRVLFPSERLLCDKIFRNLGPIADLAFIESCRGAAIQLLDFGDIVACGSKTPEKLFKVVDMYETLRDLMPDMDPLFSEQFYSVYRSLGAAIKGIFTEFENLIRRDLPKSPVPGGGLHPITRYVMNYLRAACASKRTLEQVMDEESDNPIVPSDDLDRPSSSLSVQIAWILEVLNKNLESKAKIYDQMPLSSIFLINNGRYIINKVKDSELAILMGDDWIRRQTTRVKRWCSDYQKATWSKVAAVIKSDNMSGSEAMRGKIKIFNGYLEEIWMEQREWVVVDEMMKEELRDAAVGLVVPAYKNFLLRWKGNAKYNLTDVEGMISELFEGSGR